VAHEVLETPVAASQVDALRGPRKCAYSAFLLELAANGCAAMSYRLTGPDPLPRLCVRHLRGADRVIVAFEQQDRAWVVLVGPHNDDRESNVYNLLYTITGTPIEPSGRRTKPPCCDEDGTAPVSDEDLVIQLARRTRDVFGR
jgi:hypothetical protein